MDKRRYVVQFEVEVDEGPTRRTSVFDTIRGGLDKLDGIIGRISRILILSGELVHEGDPQGDYDPPEADDTLGD